MKRIPFLSTNYLHYFHFYQLIIVNYSTFHKMLDSGVELDGPQMKQFWTVEKRHKQAAAMDAAAKIEREAYHLALTFISENESFG